MMQNSFRSKGLYIFDEPEAALSPQRQLTLLVEINKCIEKGSQFIIATHSPIILGMPGAQILSFDDGNIHECMYEETDSYQITSMFINDKERLLSKLLGVNFAAVTFAVYMYMVPICYIFTKKRWFKTR